MSVAGRLIYSLGFIVFGVLHFMNAPGLAGLVPAYIPGGVLWVYVTGILFVASAVAIIAGRYTRPAGIVLAVTLASFVLTIHLPSVLDGNSMSLSQLLKDSMLAGAALVIAGLPGRQAA